LRQGRRRPADAGLPPGRRADANGARERHSETVPGKAARGAVGGKGLGATGPGAIEPRRNHHARVIAMHDPLLFQTRRHFFRDCALGLGSMALASLAAEGKEAKTNPLAPKKPHFAPKAKTVIFLFMAGGPSQLELFDHKPKLTALSGK